MTTRTLAAARAALLQLHQHVTDEKGQPPSIEEFYPIDVESLIRLQGWEPKVVQSAGIAPDFARDNLAGQAVGQTKTILVTRDERNPGRQRFTLAHELGHVLLHGDLCAAVSLPREEAARDIDRPRELPPHEREANRFATELLLPPKAVKRRFRELFGAPPLSRRDARGKSLITGAGVSSRTMVTAEKLAGIVAAYRPEGKPDLASFFGVSRKAMTIRLLELGLVT